MKKLIWIVMALLIGGHAFADEIEVPEDELARESTLPVFDKRQAVLNRNVNSDQRIEVGAGGGVEMNEPFYNDYMLNADVTYNFTQTSAVNVQGLFWLPGLSSYGNQLRQTGQNFKAFDASEAPHPSWALMANYEYVAYYGKISVAKDAVMNLNLFGLAGLGYMNLGTVSTVAFNIGLGQNFFFTRNFGLRWDLRWLIFQGPNPTTQQLTPGVTPPSPSSFGNEIFFNTQLGLALVFIL